MKKLLLILISLFMVMGIAGCGPTPKEEAKQFNDTYFEKEFRGEINPAIQGQTDALFNNYPNNSATSPGSTEISSKMNAFIDKVKNVKIQNKEVEPLKEDFIKYMTNLNNQFSSLMANEKADVFNTKYVETLKSKFDYLNECSKLTTGNGLSTMTVDGKKYYASVVSNVVFAVTSIREDNTVGEGFFAKKAQGKFIIINIGIYNNQKDAITVDSNSFHLIDKQGHQFSTSTEGMSAIQLSEGHTKGFLTQLNPTMSMTGTFVFDVPANAKTSDFQLQAQGGFTGDKTIIDLRNLWTGY